METNHNNIVEIKSFTASVCAEAQNLKKKKQLEIAKRQDLKYDNGSMLIVSIH